jgi:pimeloyl-ACP methyl ester carboxylesterase
VVQRDPDRFSQENVLPFSFDAEREVVALGEVLHPERLRGTGDQHFSTLIMNRDFAESAPPVLLFNGFREDVHGLPGRWRAMQFAAALQDRMVVLVDLPSHGTSDKATPAQRAAIATTGNMTSIALSQMVAIRNRFPWAHDTAVVGGVSLGALPAIEAVHPAVQERSGFAPAAYMGIEGAGFDRRFVGALFYGFFVADRRRRAMYEPTAPGAKTLYDAYTGFEATLREYDYTGEHHNPDRVMQEDRRLIALIAARRVLNNGRSFGRLREALETTGDMTAHLANGGISAVVRWERIAPQVQKLHEDYPGRVFWEVWPNDSHGMGSSAQQPRLAAFAREALSRPEQ